MTPVEYTDPVRWPLTTQKGVPALTQLLLDAFNLGGLQDLLRNGQPLDELQRACLAELEEKASCRAEFMATLERTTQAGNALPRAASTDQDTIR